VGYFAFFALRVAILQCFYGGFMCLAVSRKVLDILVLFVTKIYNFSKYFLKRIVYQI